MPHYSTADLRALGIGEHRTRTLIAEGKLFRIIRGLYVDSLLPETVAHAIVSHYDDIALSGETAARLHLGIALTLPVFAEGRKRVDAGAFAIACSRLPSRTEIRGFPVVEALWAARSAPEFAQRILERHYSGKCGQTRLAADLKRMAKVPSWLRSIIGQTPIGSRSEMERRVARPLLSKGYRVRLNQYIGPYCFDLVLSQWKIAIELDSEKYHFNENSFISDRWKGNSGAIHGWIVLRFTDACVQWNLREVLAEIEQAIAWVKAGRPRRNYQPGFPASQMIWEWNPLVGGSQ
ncbi:type IV toxin-antitoxin system AbiEi family antitoxin domain-containing protein [Corynebacterium lactis]|uniref:DUF559 domain-containing protein n=1 Tax=Corynebacterium lactis RW2-5 TaxID=1408189 RepID=A0A0K2H3L3_9CORY|nr:type IV toxin-antitoxin system AbiEi family antitoxin domain-containing protein [Corynebacterium lactis]ALA68538.1 hypothetical protein CLAC_07135 [Corynebacterium lactis RW2-5]